MVKNANPETSDQSDAKQTSQNDAPVLLSDSAHDRAHGDNIDEKSKDKDDFSTSTKSKTPYEFYGLRSRPEEAIIADLDTNPKNNPKELLLMYNNYMRSQKAQAKSYFFYDFSHWCVWMALLMRYTCFFEVLNC